MCFDRTSFPFEKQNTLHQRCSFLAVLLLSSPILSYHSRVALCPWLLILNLEPYYFLSSILCLRVCDFPAKRAFRFKHPVLPSADVHTISVNYPPTLCDGASVFLHLDLASNYLDEPIAGWRLSRLLRIGYPILFFVTFSGEWTLNCPLVD